MIILFLRETWKRNLFSAVSGTNTSATIGLRLEKSVRIRYFSGTYFPVFGLNTGRCRESLLIQSECEKTRTRKSPSTDTFWAVWSRRYRWTQFISLELFIVWVENFTFYKECQSSHSFQYSSHKCLFSPLPKS